MKQRNKLYHLILISPVIIFFQQLVTAQVSHVLKHVGAVNTSIGSASTAHLFDINGFTMEYSNVI